MRFWDLPFQLTRRRQLSAANAISQLRRRLEDVESQLEEANRRIAQLMVAVESTERRCNAIVDLTEQRFDLIYRRVVEGFSQYLSLGVLSTESDTDLDKRLAHMLSGGLKVDVDPHNIDIALVVTNQLRPATIRSPLTLYGFRLNRTIARERGDSVEVSGVDGECGSVALFGPYKRLSPGQYTVAFNFNALSADRCLSKTRPRGEIALDVYSPATGDVLGDRVIPASELTTAQSISAEFDWFPPAANDFIEFRFHQRSNVTLRIASLQLLPR